MRTVFCYYPLLALFLSVLLHFIAIDTYNISKNHLLTIQRRLYDKP